MNEFTREELAWMRRLIDFQLPHFRRKATSKRPVPAAHGAKVVAEGEALIAKIDAKLAALGPLPGL